LKNFGHDNPLDWQHIRTRDIRPIDLSHTYVVTMCSNPARYRSRYDAHRVFIKNMHDAGAQVVVVEVAYGQRPFEVTEAGNPFHVQLRSEHEEIWLKEWAWNIGMNRIPDKAWEYVIFSDNDITFTKPTWLSETVHQLQSHMVVQPFSYATDLGPNHELLKTYNGFAFSYHQNMFHPPQFAGTGGYYGAEKGEFWHPGFAMAYRREVFEGAGMPGLLTAGMLGAGDHHMWLAMIGEAQRSLPGKISPGYKKAVLDWQADAERVINRDIGYCAGTILHTWGGPKAKRFYVSRWSIIEECQSDPSTDVIVDWQGLPQLKVTNPRQRRQRDLFRNYFRVRDEDSNDASQEIVT
jgi:hypothetical protein